MIEDLSRHFERILTDFRFPKLSATRLDRHFIPYVRGNVYRRIGSTGALTLISIAW